ncbi:MAG TPA: rod shape-determining protein MreC, partial [Mucilaginibacter sp.]
NAGIEKGQGVICSSGIVGKVLYVDKHFSIVQSLLHKDSQFSAMLANDRVIGSFGWGDDLDPHKGLLYDVSNNAAPKLGELVVTSDRSLFPAGVPIGKISSLNAKNGKGAFLSMDVTLAVDFGKLDYVYVVTNRLAKEQLGLEAQEK